MYPWLESLWTYPTLACFPRNDDEALVAFGNSITIRLNTNTSNVEVPGEALEGARISARQGNFNSAFDFTTLALEFAPDPTTLVHQEALLMRGMQHMCTLVRPHTDLWM
jgi:hypothetical protein